MKKLHLILLLVIASFNVPNLCFGQDNATRIKELEDRIKNATQDTVRADTYIDLSQLYPNDPQKRVEYTKKALEYAKKTDFIYFKHRASVSLAMNYYDAGDLTNSLKYFKETLEYIPISLKTTKDPVRKDKIRYHQAIAYNGIGSIALDKEDLPLALETFLNAIRTCWEIKFG